MLIIVDEFQHAPALYDTYLPRIRKHHGSYVCIAQGIGQVDAMQEGLHTTVFNNAATHVFFRTRDYHDADYLAHVLDGETLTYRDLQLLGLRQCYVATTDGERPLDPVLVTLPPPPATSPAAARLIAASCARRYGRPRDAVVAAYKKWLADLYHADRAATRASAAQPTGTVGDTGDATTGSTEIPSTPVPGGSQPALGLPVQRAAMSASAARPRRTSRRHKGPRPVPLLPVQLTLPTVADPPTVPTITPAPPMQPAGGPTEVQHA